MNLLYAWLIVGVFLASVMLLGFKSRERPLILADWLYIVSAIPLWPVFGTSTLFVLLGWHRASYWVERVFFFWITIVSDEWMLYKMREHTNAATAFDRIMRRCTCGHLPEQHIPNIEQPTYRCLKCHCVEYKKRLAA